MSLLLAEWAPFPAAAGSCFTNSLLISVSSASSLSLSDSPAVLLWEEQNNIHIPYSVNVLEKYKRIHFSLHGLRLVISVGKGQHFHKCLRLQLRLYSSTGFPVRYNRSCVLLMYISYQERIRGRSVQLPYNRVYYRSLKPAAVHCCYSELGPFFALCSSLLPAFTSIHASSYSFPTKTSEH